MDESKFVETVRQAVGQIPTPTMSFGFVTVASQGLALDQNMTMKESSRHTVVRRSDEPRLDIGDSMAVREGVTGTVIARFTRSGSSDVHYIVEVRPNDETDKTKAVVPN